MRVYGKLGRYSYFISDPRHYTEVSGAFDAPAALCPEKGPVLPLDELHCRCRDFAEKEHFLSLLMLETQVLRIRVCRRVPIPTELSQLL